MTLQKMLSYSRRAIQDYDMIDDGDKVAIGLSGGKDSTALLVTLKALSSFYPKHFELCAITIDMGFENTDLSPLRELCKRERIEYTVVPTKLKSLIFDVREEKNPCSLCSKMRRGALTRACASIGAGKLALGHHMDDVIDTFLMNLTLNGRIGTFSPKTELDRSGVTVIRPFVYAPEKEIRAFVNKSDLPIVKSGCPVDKKTSREDVKELVNTLALQNRDIKNKILGAIKRAGLDGFHE